MGDNRNRWEVFKSKSHFIVGNRRRVKFWIDRWCGDLYLEVFTGIILYDILKIHA